MIILHIPADPNEHVNIRDIPHTLNAMQKEVGGYIDCVRIDHEVDMWINDKGKLKDLPHNARATWVAEQSLSLGDYIQGDCFLACQKNGDTVGIPKQFAVELKKIIDEEFPG